MATGSPKSRWNKKDADTTISDFSENTLPTISLSYTGKRPEQDILKTVAAAPQILWRGVSQSEEHTSNRLYYGNNLPILASLLQNSTIKGNVRLVYIDPPFATNSIFQSKMP